MTLLNFGYEGVAPPSGWSVDKDLWFTRARRSGDIDLTSEACHFGFTLPDEVFVRTAAFALCYDRGHVVPWAANDNDLCDGVDCPRWVDVYYGMQCPRCKVLVPDVATEAEQ